MIVPYLVGWGSSTHLIYGPGGRSDERGGSVGLAVDHSLKVSRGVH